jgi:hypothetical protein
MNKLLGSLIALSLIAIAARADQFQLKEPETAGGYDVSYAKVSITGDHGFSGRTDKFGRITIDGLGNGTYPAEVIDSRGLKKSAKFDIDNLGSQSKLKIVYVQ